MGEGADRVYGKAFELMRLESRKGEPPSQMQQPT
jgi:hypothetical protein